MGQPSFESHRADSPGRASGYQRLIIQFGAEIARVNIGGHLPRVFAVTQNATDTLVQSKFLGARYFEQAIHRWAEHEARASHGQSPRRRLRSDVCDFQRISHPPLREETSIDKT